MKLWYASLVYYENSNKDVSKRAMHISSIWEQLFLLAWRLWNPDDRTFKGMPEAYKYHYHTALPSESPLEISRIEIWIERYQAFQLSRSMHSARQRGHYRIVQQHQQQTIKNITLVTCLCIYDILSYMKIKVYWLWKYKVQGFVREVFMVR